MRPKKRSDFRLRRSHNPDSYDLSPGQVLLANQLAGGAGYRTLFINSGPGIITTGLIDRLSGGSIEWIGRDQASLELAQEQLTDYTEVKAHVSFDARLTVTQSAWFDQVAILIPKSRALARRWLVTAYLALKPGGKLYLAGPNDLGIRSLIKDAEAIFLPATILGYKKGNRVARLHKPNTPLGLPDSPDWLSAPGIRPDSWQEFQFSWQDRTWHFFSLPGVFSSDHLDDGTRLLLEQLHIDHGAAVLDFGCGCGVIGLLAGWMGAGSVDLVDIDLLAVASARKNAAELQISNVRCLAGNGLNMVEGSKYDYILSNPPFHAGRAVSYHTTENFIVESGRLLKKSGQLIIVANRFIPYEQNLEQSYRKIVRLAENSRYQVLAASKPLKTI